MDPTRNPYAPGAGVEPPELAGRDDVRERARIAIERIRLGNPTKSLLLVGLRGVGKTVLLTRIRKDSRSETTQTIAIEAGEKRSFVAQLASELRVTIAKLSMVERAKHLAHKAQAALASFSRIFRLKFEDLTLSLDCEPEKGIADSGDLELDLRALLIAAGTTAQAANHIITLFIDELQYVSEPELAALITALHHVAQEGLPLIMLGAGLPQLRGQMGNAKSYAERLFDIAEIGQLTQPDAINAIEKPAHALNVTFEREAVERIVDDTRGYPYFLQEWGKHAWDGALATPITLRDVESAAVRAIEALDQSFFHIRFDRLTNAEKDYLRAMAQRGAGPHRSGDIARALKRQVRSVAPTRHNLIKKGMIWSPTHGETAFTVPLFDEFMVRKITDFNPHGAQRS